MTTMQRRRNHLLFRLAMMAVLTLGAARVVLDSLRNNPTIWPILEWSSSRTPARVCWAGMSMYECTTEFRFFWLNNKLVEPGACNDPSNYNKYRFRTLIVYNYDQEDLKAAYNEPVLYVKDGLLFYNKNTHYESGNTPLVLVRKDENCSLVCS